MRCVYCLKNETYVFYRVNKTLVRVRVRMNLITCALAPEPVPICYYRDKTRVHISILTRPYLSNVLHYFFGKRMLTRCRSVDCSLGSQ